MNPDDRPQAVLPSAASYHAPDIAIPELVGKIYDAAPIAERCRMLEHLMKPLGVWLLLECVMVFLRRYGFVADGTTYAFGPKMRKPCKAST